MKITPFPLGALALLSVGLTISLAMAQTQPLSGPPAPPRLTITPSGLMRQLRGEANFLERIALPPGAMLHVSLIGRVAGAEYLPLATAIVPAQNGTTPFTLSLPRTGTPAGPFRLQAWIIADNRAMFVGRDAQTTLAYLDKPAQIRLKLAPAPQNIDGIGNGKPLSVAPKTITLRGNVSKLDRRALLPDSRIELSLSDVSLADAPSKLVMGQVIQLEGAQLPKTFELQLEATDLLPRRRYALSARILEAGKLTYITNTLHEVTPENLKEDFELKVVPAAPTP